jgi:hypothetical protein
MAMDNSQLIILSIFAVAASICVCARAEAQTSPEVLAAQIRAQGYHCEPPLSAERDAELSKPNQAVWILKCRASTFRIRLDPDMAAKVEKLN